MIGVILIKINSYYIISQLTGKISLTYTKWCLPLSSLFPWFIEWLRTQSYLMLTFLDTLNLVQSIGECLREWEYNLDER